MLTEVSTAAQALIQFGFAGFCVMLLGVNVWLVRELVGVLKENNKVLADHNVIMQHLGTKVGSVEELQVTLKDKLNSRPCIAKHEQ